MREFIQEFEHTTGRMYQMLYGAVEDPEDNQDIADVFDWFNFVFRSAIYALLSGWIADKSRQLPLYNPHQLRNGKNYPRAVRYCDEGPEEISTCHQEVITFPFLTERSVAAGEMPPKCHPYYLQAGTLWFCPHSHSPRPASPRQHQPQRNHAAYRAEGVQVYHRLLQPQGWGQRRKSDQGGDFQAHLGVIEHPSPLLTPHSIQVDSSQFRNRIREVNRCQTP